MELSLSTTLGPDWRNFFDLVMANAGKARFFQMERPFFEMDSDRADYKGPEITDAAQLQADSALTFLEGNCKMLTECIKHQLNMPDPQIAYLGDECVNDIHWANAAPGWDGIATIEEMCMAEDYGYVEANSALQPLDPKQIPNAEYWGSEFFLHSTDEPKKNWYLDQLQNHARYAIPLVRHITNFINE